MRVRYELQAGFTYIGLLVAIVIVGLMLTLVSRIWSVSEQRERETQLLFAGDAIRLAIASYYASGHRYPLSLQDLILDDRSPVPIRHLRRLYSDPMTGTADWTLLHSPDGVGVMGVASSSKLAPTKRKSFSPVDATFADSDCYCAWQFVYVPRSYLRKQPVSSP
jgi:type II secretory pathway pseudopilin PulG